jgi:hypothetical protein
MLALVEGSPGKRMRSAGTWQCRYGISSPAMHTHTRIAVVFCESSVVCTQQAPHIDIEKGNVIFVIPLRLSLVRSRSSAFCSTFIQTELNSHQFKLRRVLR